eukprot:1156737-Pelagomonas_calceolata.AAC.5
MQGVTSGLRQAPQVFFAFSLQPRGGLAERQPKAFAAHPKCTREGDGQRDVSWFYSGWKIFKTGVHSSYTKHALQRCKECMATMQGMHSIDARHARCCCHACKASLQGMRKALLQGMHGRDGSYVFGVHVQQTLP